MSKEKSCVYLFKCLDRYKIGVSKDVNKRLAQFRNLPFPIRLVSKSKPILNAYIMEKDLHSMCERYRVIGEWFNLPQDMVEYLSDIIITAEDYL